MPIATFFTLGKTTMQSALSRILVGRPLSPERMACMAVAEFASRSSSFFWAKRGDASARHSARVTNLLFKVLSFRDEKLNHEPKLGNGFLGRLSGRLLRRDALYTDLSESCDLNRACSSWRVGYRSSTSAKGGVDSAVQISTNGRGYARRVAVNLKRLAIGILIFGMLAAASAASAQNPGLQFKISFPASAHAEPITGRVFVILSKTEEMEPRFQIGRTGVPFFGRDISQVSAGEAAVIDASDLGSPVESLNDLPPGDYFVQAMISVYSEFKRADGHTVWMHDDQWEGQLWARSPGNLKSKVKKVHLDPRAAGG